MNVLNKGSNKDFPLTWANLDYLPESKGHKLEIYLTNNSEVIDSLILMFYILFRETKNNVKVFNLSWWDYCLDTWNPFNDSLNYSIDAVSPETKDYLIMLKESDIENGYSGVCECNDWTRFLSVILTCILTHRAPYSPIFFNEENDFFFYFHHTGSIGFYYRSKNDVIEKIIGIAAVDYDIS